MINKYGSGAGRRFGHQRLGSAPIAFRQVVVDASHPKLVASADAALRIRIEEKFAATDRGLDLMVRQYLHSAHPGYLSAFVRVAGMLTS